MKNSRVHFSVKIHSVVAKITNSSSEVFTLKTKKTLEQFKMFLEEYCTNNRLNIDFYGEDCEIRAYESKEEFARDRGYHWSLNDLYGSERFKKQKEIDEQIDKDWKDEEGTVRISMNMHLVESDLRYWTLAKFLKDTLHATSTRD